MITHTTTLTLPELKTAIVRNPLVVTPDAIVTDAIAQMSSVRSQGNATRTTDSPSTDSGGQASCVVVVENNQVVGILTERDIVRLSAQQQPLDRLAMRQVMTHPVFTLRESAFADLFFVVNLLQHHQIRHLPILDQQDRLVGLVTHESLCQIARSLALLRLRQVAEVMTHEVICAAPDSSLLTIAQLMSEHCVSSVTIMKPDGSPMRSRQIPVGILTERDLVQSQALGLNLESCLAATVMKTPIYEITPEESLLKAQQIMDQRFVRHLAVTGQPRELMGIVTQTNVLQALNPSNLYKMAENLAEKVAHLEAENVALLKSHTLEIEQQVEARTKRYATLAAAPVGIFRTDAAGNCTYLNDRWFQITGLPLQVSMDEGWQQALHSEDRSRVATEWYQAVQEGRPFELEYRFQHPDGRVAWVYGQAVAERDEVGTVLSYVGTLTDISDRKRSEEALQNSEAHQRALISAIPDLIMRMNRAGIYLEFVATPNFYVIGHLPDIVGTHTGANLPFDVAQKRLKFIQLALETNSIQIYEQDFSIEGRTQFEEVRIVPYSEDEVLVLVRDISDRKQAEFALQQSEAKSRAVLAAIPDLMFRVRADGTFYGYITSHRNLGVLSSEIDITGRTMADMLSPELAERQLHYLQKALQTGELQMYEHQVQVADRLQHEEVRVIKSGEDEVLFMVRDISDRKQAEAALQCLIESTASVTGKDFFSTLAQQLMLTLKVQQVLVTKLLGDHHHLQTLAYWKEGALQPEITFALADSPCSKLAIEQGQFYCSKGLQQRFSEYPFIQSFHAESYLGIPIKSTTGQTLGNLCILDNKPMENIQWAEAFLRIFALRAAAELERQQATEALEQLNQELEARVEQRTSALRTSEANLSAIFNQAAVGMNLATLDGQYVKVNQKMCDLLGYTQEEFLTKNFKDIFHPEEEDKGQAERQQLYAGAIDSFSIEKRYLHKDGSAVWINLTVSLIYKPSGEPAYSIGVVKEIGDRKQAEETLNRQLALIEASIDGIIMFNPNGECTYLNEAHVKLFGYDYAEELLGKSWQTLCSPSELDRVKQDISPRLVETRAWRGEAIAVRRDGSTFDNEVSLTLTPTGEVICVCRDISDRRQAEQALQQSEEQFRTVFDYAPVAISLARVDDYQIFRVNAAHYQLFGYSDAELATMSFADFAAPDDADQQIEHVRQMVRGEIPGFQMEKRLIKKNGEVILTNMTIALVKDQEGCPLYSMAMMEDITERRQAELEIIRNRDLREAIFNESTDAIFLVNVEPSITIDCNRRAVELFEASAKDELLQIAGHTLQRHQFTDEELELISQEIADKGLWSCEVEYITRKGNSFWGNLSAKQVSVAGRVMNLVHVTDISERKQSELLLKAQQEFLRRLIDTVPNLIFVKDWKGRFTLVNQATANVYQSTIEDLVGKTDADFNSNLEELERFSAVDQEVMAAMTTKVLEQTVTSPNGKQSYFQTIKTPIMSADGESREILGVATDISDRRQIEEHLRRSEAYLLEAQRIAHVGSWEFDMVTRKITWSAETFRIFGLDTTQQEPTYEELTQYIHPDDRDDYTAILRQTLDQGHLFELEHRVLQPDGTVRYVLTKGQLILDQTGGKLFSFLGTVLDITDRKQSEEQLRQTNEQLARTTRLKDEFLANMSHELRTPLNAILGMTEGLQDQAFGTVNERQVKALQTIERSGSHLLELINDILDIAKVEAGQLELDIMPTAVMSLCQSSLAFVKQQALKKRIQLEIKLPPNLPDLSVDGRRIRQVLINLLNNAVKFTPDGGRITLQVSHYQPPAAPESADSPLQTFLRIAVIDTGIGIAPEHIDKLFQPFIQIDSALNRQYQGTGLGLALVKRIVELHGGQVGLTSEVGAGSCFTIDLPYVVIPFSPELKTQLEPITAPSKLAGASPLILLAEDNEASIIMVSSYLRAKGYQVLLAKSGQEAVALAQAKIPNLILMDIQMPGVDGLEAMQQIRRDPTLVNVPIIALTVLAMTSDRERCLAAGATDYLSKPILLKQLVTTIQQLLKLS